MSLAMIERVSRRAWGWLGRHWLAILFPLALFLLGAGVTRQVLWAWRGIHESRFDEHYRAAQEAGQAGDRETALRKLNEAAASAPNDPEVSMRLAQGFEQLGQRTTTLKYMERAVRLRPEEDRAKVHVWLGLARSYCDSGAFDDAERILKKDILPRWPDSAEAHYHQARIHLYRDSKGEEELPEALAELETSLRLDPELAGARHQYGVCLARLGRLDEAEKALRAAVEAAPQLAGAQHELAGVLRRQGKKEEAARVLEQFQAINHRQLRIRRLQTQDALHKATPAELLELGELYLDEGRVQEALSPLVRYTRKEPTDPKGHRLLGKAYRQVDQVEEADLSLKLAEALETGGRPTP